MSAKWVTLSELEVLTVDHSTRYYYEQTQ